MENAPIIHQRLCSVEGCGKIVVCRSLCKNHYQSIWRKERKAGRKNAWYRLNDFIGITKFICSKRKIDCLSGCWNWTGSMDKGYGVINIHWAQYRISRISAMIYLGFDIESSLFILHHCDNPACFNPSHLFIGTQKDNIRDCIKKKRFVIVRGTDRGSAKLNDEKIREIRSKRSAGERCVDLAKEYKIDDSVVTRICQRKTWRHVS